MAKEIQRDTSIDRDRENFKILEALVGEFLFAENNLTAEEQKKFDEILQKHRWEILA